MFFSYSTRVLELMRPWLIVAGLMFLLGALEGFWSRQEEEIRAEAELVAERKKAVLTTVLLTACLDGDVYLQIDGKPVSYCRRVK